MNYSEIRAGMKVVPHSKSTYLSLEHSQMWKLCIEHKQPYMIVVGDEFDVDSGQTVIILSHTDLLCDGGDFFLPSDFEPYEENKHESSV